MTELFQDAETSSQSEGRAARRRSSSETSRRRAAQRRRTLITFVLMVAALVGLVWGAWSFVAPFLRGENRGQEEETVTDYPGPGTGEVSVSIAAGSSGAEIGQTLVDADVVASVQAFVSAYNANPNATGIQPGAYTLPQQMAARDAVTALLDPASRSGLTIPEGWRSWEIYERIATTLELPVEDVEAAGETVTLPEEAAGAIEGWLFATTYPVAEDATPESILQAMVDQTVVVLERNGVPREEWHDVIIVASIVEREVNRPEDRPYVAQVIENRLPPVMCGRSPYIGMDSTLSYELGLSANQIDHYQESDYNTRNSRHGLPPTAISSPSEASIAAAADPPEGDFCYLVTVNLDTGETKFAETYAEHNANVAELREWEAENR